MKKENLRICFLAAEVAPFAKTGGLADVSGALPTYLKSRGHDVRLFMPLHAQIDRSDLDLVPVDFLRGVPIQMGSHAFHFSVLVGRLAHDFGSGGALDVYFVDCPELFHRPGIYTGDWDEHLRFGLFSRAVLETCQHMGWGPQIVHCNDWHTALIPLYLKSLYAWDAVRFSQAKSVLTIHNIAYQGIFPADVVGNLGLAAHAGSLHQEHLYEGRVNFLETGILWADAITTVSPTYSREIQTPAFGEGLDHLLRQRSANVVGILNGVDYGAWDPAVDEHLPRRYTIDDVAEGKAENKARLLRQLGLAPTDTAPLLGIVSRLVAQKGFDLAFDPLPRFLAAHDLRVAILGTGEQRYEGYFHSLQKRFPGKVCYYRGYSEKLAHLIEAASDVFLMPSLFEPCGLNQMYSLKYGTPPLVRKTGGLADTVEHFHAGNREGTGFVFEHFDSPGFSWGLGQALEAWKDQEAWARLRRNGMERDYSWERQGEKYEELYARLIEG